MNDPLILPVEAKNRLGHIDMLRGFALFGVLISNIEYWFRAPKDHQWLVVKAWPGFGDQTAAWLIRALVEMKSVFMLSLLFGAGLAMQAGRAGETGKRFGGFGIRRLLVLLVLGILHAFLIWHGDILATYAVTGLIAMLFLSCKPKTLWILLGGFWAAIVVIVLIEPVSRMFGSPLKPLSEARMLAMDKENWDIINRISAGFGSESWLDFFKFNVTAYLHVLKSNAAGNIAVFVNVVMGFAFWKSGILRDPLAHLSKLRRFTVWALPVGLAMHGIYASQLTLLTWRRTIPWEFGRFVAPAIDLSMIMGTLLLGISFITILLALYQKPAAKRVLGWLEPLGRMTLTAYLSQSIVMTFIFYGWGLGFYNTIGPLGGFLIGMGFFAMQLFFARWWLSRFKFGPVEWLWRSLSYGKRQAFMLTKRERL